MLHSWRLQLNYTGSVYRYVCRLRLAAPNAQPDILKHCVVLLMFPIFCTIIGDKASRTQPETNTGLFFALLVITGCW